MATITDIPWKLYSNVVVGTTTAVITPEGMMYNSSEGKVNEPIDVSRTDWSLYHFNISTMVVAISVELAVL
jgi:hypothetical protein